MCIGSTKGLDMICVAAIESGGMAEAVVEAGPKVGVKVKCVWEVAVVEGGGGAGRRKGALAGTAVEGFAFHPCITGSGLTPLFFGYAGFDRRFPLGAAPRCPHPLPESYRLSSDR